MSLRSLVGWGKELLKPGSTCGLRAPPPGGPNGSIIAQLVDQNNNAIAAVKLQQFGPGTTNVPINGTFSAPLSVTSFTIQYFVDLCGPQTVAFSLVMS